MKPFNYFANTSFVACVCVFFFFFFATKDIEKILLQKKYYDIG